MQIEITQQNIDEGRQNNAVDCAIARAFKERGAKSVYVCNLLGRLGRVVAKVDGNVYTLGNAGEAFVHKFDEAKSLVSPIVLTLSPYFSHSSLLSSDSYAYSAYSSKLTMTFIDEVGSVGVPPKSTQFSQWYMTPKISNQYA